MRTLEGRERPSEKASSRATGLVDGKGAHTDRSARRLRLWELDRYRLLPLLGYLALCGLTYISTLTVSYAFSDDYPSLAAAMRGNLHYEVEERVLAGRPTLALVFEAIFLHVHSIGDLRFVRLIGVIGVAVLAWLLFRTLLSAGANVLLALLLPIFICTLPPFQVYVAWSITSFNTFSCVLAGLSLITVERAIQATESMPADAGSREKLRLLLFPAAALLLFLALTMVQTNGLFYWVFAAIVLFVSDRPLSWILRRLCVYVAVAAVAMDGALTAVKFVPLWTYGKAALKDPTTGRNQLVAVSDIPAKASWFFTSALENALNLDNVVPTALWAIVTAVMVVVGLMLYFKGGMWTRLGKLAVAGVLVPASYLANLVVAENWSTYRTQIALTPLIAVYAALALCGFARSLDNWSARGRVLPPMTCERVILPAVVAGAALAGVILAARNVTVEFVNPAVTEYRLLVSDLRAAPLANASKIVFIQPDRTDSLAPFVRYDEFGLPSSLQVWVPAPMTYIALREVDPARADLPVQMMTLPDTTPPPPQQVGSVVIDMRTLRHARSLAPDVAEWRALAGDR